MCCLASVLIVADVSNVADVEYSVWDIWNDVSDEFKGFDLRCLKGYF